MKKFICGSCRGEWYSDENQARSVCCPYCRAEIPGPPKPETVDTLGKAIYSAVSALDLDILSQGSRMKGYLMDTVCDMPELKKEIRLFFKFFNQDYLSRYKEAFSGNLTEASSVLSRIEYYLVEDEALDKARARQMIESCMEAVLYHKRIFGNPEELYALGKRYYYGTDTEKDYTKAVKYFQKAADQGLANAQDQLALCYYYEKGIGQDYGKAAQWWQKAADQGQTNAQYNLGFCYKNGQGVPKNPSKAAEWFQKAADQGYQKAQYSLGLCYKNGQGVPMDPAKAVEYFQKAADQGLASAQDDLALCYYYERGIAQDYEKAAQWWQKAADQGHRNAQCNLGLCYKNGKGVKQDYEKAAEWYEKAVQQGHEAAKGPLEDCRKKIEEAKAK